MDGRYSAKDGPGPAPGDWGVVRTNGIFGRGIRLVTRSTVNHAIRYVGHGLIVEATPRLGTIHSPIQKYTNVIWSTGKIDYDDSTRKKLADVCLELTRADTDYSFRGVILLGLAQYGLRNNWLEEKLSKQKNRMFCSQQIDYVDEVCGSHLFNDGRVNGDVTPQDLLELLQKGDHR